MDNNMIVVIDDDCMFSNEHNSRRNFRNKSFPQEKFNPKENHFLRSLKGKSIDFPIIIETPKSTLNINPEYDISNDVIQVNQICKTIKMEYSKEIHFLVFIQNGKSKYYGIMSQNYLKKYHPNALDSFCESIIMNHNSSDENGIIES